MFRNRPLGVVAKTLWTVKRPTVNHFKKIRTDIKKDLDEKTFQKGDFETFLSPSGKFRLDTTNYWQKESNLDLTIVEIFDQELNEKI